jgi:hypothetical protein
VLWYSSVEDSYQTPLFWELRGITEVAAKSPMKVNIRAGNLNQDAQPLLALLQEQLSSSIDRERFDWLYRKCPHGEAKVWIAEDVDSKRFVGAGAVFPRKISFETGTATGFVFGDFCVAADQRSLGLAVRLQRSCLEGVRAGSFAAGYDLPSRTMVAVYRRLGLAAGPEMVRMVKLLRADAKIASRVRPKLAAIVISKAANAALALRGSTPRRKLGVDVAVQQGRCGAEFTDLAREVGSTLGICVERSAEFLNWRYLDHPNHKYEILVARRRGHFEGYLVVHHEGTVASIVDWFGRAPVELRKDLLWGAIALLKPRGCECIQAGILTSHPFCGELEAFGFRPRESSPVVLIGKNGEANGAQGTENWLLMDGDRES